MYLGFLWIGPRDSFEGGHGGRLLRGWSPSPHPAGSAPSSPVNPGEMSFELKLATQEPITFRAGLIQESSSQLRAFPFHLIGAHGRTLATFIRRVGLCFQVGGYSDVIIIVTASI